MKYAALASGSKGNCHAFSDGERTLLVDAGISLKQIRLRLAALGWDPASVRAVALSHEHSDHIAAVPVLLRRTDWTLLATADTLAAVQAIQGIEIPPERRVVLRAGHAADWDGARLLPFTIPHDAADPVAFTFRVEGIKVGVVTDLGYMPHSVVQHIRNCDLLMIESNHDLEMLRIGPYPWSVKQRVMSRLGHLSNDALAEFLRSEYDGGAAFVVLAHLSEHNNHPELARTAAERALSDRRNLLRNRLMLASQTQPLEPLRF